MVAVALFHHFIHLTEARAKFSFDVGENFFITDHEAKAKRLELFLRPS